MTFKFSSKKEGIGRKLLGLFIAIRKCLVSICNERQSQRVMSGKHTPTHNLSIRFLNHQQNHQARNILYLTYLTVLSIGIAKPEKAL